MERFSLPIRSTFAAAVALTLAFGTSQAIADPADRTPRAACTDEICQIACERSHPGQEVIGRCDWGCRCTVIS